MRGKLLLVLGVLCLLSILPVVSAVNANVTIKTDYPFRSLVVRVQNSAGALVDNIYPGKVDINGKVNVVYETGLPEIGFEVYVVERGVVLASEIFEATSPAKPIILDLREENNEENVTNEPDEDIEVDVTLNDTGNDTQTANISLDEESLEENEGVTGQAILGNITQGISNIFYYIVAIVVLGGIIGFVVGRMIRARKVKMGLVDPPKAKANSNDVGSGGGIDAQIEDAEKKIKEAEDEINMLKGRDKLRKAEEKLKKEREELEKLKRGDEEKK